LDDLAKLGLDSQETEHLRRARSAALQALLANPLDVDSRRLLIELDFLAPSPDADTAMFDQVLRLRCNHASTLHDTAMLAVFSPGKDKAIEFWKRSLAVGPELIDYFWQDASLLIDEVTFSGALPSDPTVGIRFAELAKDSSVRDHVLYCVEQQLRQLNPAVHEIAQHQYNLGRVAELRGKFEAAEVFYALAVESNPSLTDWRFRYANMLQQNGRSEASYEQIKRCLLQSPDNLQFLQKSRELREATR
jgi:tetratricopeptide (TPR) repeat protein